MYYVLVAYGVGMPWRPEFGNREFARGRRRFFKQPIAVRTASGIDSRSNAACRCGSILHSESRTKVPAEKHDRKFPPRARERVMHDIRYDAGDAALIVSEVCFFRQSLAEIVTKYAGINVSGQSATLVHAIATAEARRPEIVLLDVAFPYGIDAAHLLSRTLPESSMIAVGLAETEANVLAWARAGVTGYVPNTASINELVLRIAQIRRGEQACPAGVVGGLLRRIGSSERAAKAPTAAALQLTRRELEISRLVAEGLSNKDIARRLGISVATAKSHVHNLLNKLNLRRRTEIAVQLFVSHPGGRILSRVDSDRSAL